MSLLGISMETSRHLGASNANNFKIKVKLKLNLNWNFQYCPRQGRD